MDKNSFTNWFNLSNVEGISPSQKSKSRSKKANISSPNCPENSNIPPPPPQGFTGAPYFQGFPPQGFPPQGFPPQGYPPQGFPPQGYGNPYGFSPQGYPTTGSRRTSTDGTSSDKEYATPSPQGIESINLDNDVDSEDQGNPAPLKKIPYSSVENELLAQCWIDTSIDSVVGNDQKLDQMWMRICTVYNKNRPTNTPTRHFHNLKTHFYTLQKYTRLFCECYNRNAKIWGSGKSDADIMEMAQQEYMSRHHRQGFKHIGVWRLLSACPKFAMVDGDVRSKKKMKTSETGAYTSSSAAEEDEGSRVRPIGQKAAKRNAKSKGKSTELEEVKEGWHEKNKTLQRLSRAKEYDILMKDTSDMTPQQLSIHLYVCEQIKKEWGIE